MTSAAAAVASGAAPPICRTDGNKPARLDFHLHVGHRIHHACRVVRKARAAAQTVLVYTRDADRLARFDLALWTFSAFDFLPHVDADSPLAAATPIWLARQPLARPRDVLLLLDDEIVPDFEPWFELFGRVIEIVSADESDRRLARIRYRAYRGRGIEPTMHSLASG